MKINKLTIHSNSLLPDLSVIPNSPKTLYYIGNLPPKHQTKVAIVGSRRPTNYGRSITKQISEVLASRGVAIISGLALGVDSIAHSAALGVGGYTLAVLPSGVDDPYPKSNQMIARNILKQGGALISEFKDGHRPRRHDFLLRNRLVSGLSDVLVVTEANLRSGTLSTVAHALEQGKDVYAVPGPITSPLSAGCNRLIKQGARPITDIDSFLDEIGLTANTEVTHGDNELEQRIIDLINQGINDGNIWAEKLKIDYQELAPTITLMEIKGYISSLGGNQWRL